MSDDDLDRFDELYLERERTLYWLHGFRWAEGTRRAGELGGNYFKHAHSLREALADLQDNPATRDPLGGHAVRDVFLIVDEDAEPEIHVELVPLTDLLNLLEDANDDD